MEEEGKEEESQVPSFWICCFLASSSKTKKKRNLTKTWSMKLIHFGESISNFPFFSLHFVITNIGDILFLWILYSIFFSHRILFVRLNKKKMIQKWSKSIFFFSFTSMVDWLQSIPTKKKWIARCEIIIFPFGVAKKYSEL